MLVNRQYDKNPVKFCQMKCGDSFSNMGYKLFLKIKTIMNKDMLVNAVDFDGLVYFFEDGSEVFPEPDAKVTW